jgi:hypothetical protein
MSLSDTYDDHMLMMKAATAVMILAVAIVVILLIAGWISLVILGAAFVYVGIATMIDGNTTVGVAEFVVGVIGWIFAIFILVLYYDATCGM